MKKFITIWVIVFLLAHAITVSIGKKICTGITDVSVPETNVNGIILPTIDNNCGPVETLHVLGWPAYFVFPHNGDRLYFSWDKFAINILWTVGSSFIIFVVLRLRHKPSHEENNHPAS